MKPNLFKRRNTASSLPLNSADRKLPHAGRAYKIRDTIKECATTLSFSIDIPWCFNNFSRYTIEVVLFWVSKVKGQGHQADSPHTHPVNAQYLPKGKAYEVQTWYTDGAWIPVSATSAVTSKVKGEGRKVTWRIRQVLADKSRTKHPRNTKIGGKVTHPTGNNAYKFQGHRSRSAAGRLMLAQGPSIISLVFLLLIFM